MYYTKYSRKHKIAFTFSLSSSGYVSVEIIGGYNGGTSNRQICNSGLFRGETITANKKTFEKTCNRWYRSHLSRI